MNKKILFCSGLILFFAFFNCTDNREEKAIKSYKNILMKSGFDFTYWLSDSMGYNYKNKERNAKIFINQNFIKDCSQSIIIRLLGKPYKKISRNNKIMLFYIIDGRLMYDNLKTKHVLLDNNNSYLIITFDNTDKLINTEFREY